MIKKVLLFTIGLYLVPTFFCAVNIFIFGTESSEWFAEYFLLMYLIVYLLFPLIYKNKTVTLFRNRYALYAVIYAALELWGLLLYWIWLD